MSINKNPIVIFINSAQELTIVYNDEILAYDIIE